MARGVSVSDLSNKFASEEHTYRGTTYVVRELSMQAYDRTVKAATIKDETSGEDNFDAQAHNKILVAKCVSVNGKPIDADELYESGTRVVRQLQRIVQKLHWDEEPEDEKADIEVGEAPAEAS
jgi:hypothetical protein